MKIVATSDTHNYRPQIPEADIFVHAGDATMGGTVKEILAYAKWLHEIPATYKLIVAGNHDILLQDNLELALQIFADNCPEVVYLQDNYVVIDDIKIFGTPWVPKYGNWAFMLSPQEIAKKWATIPEDIDILVTHGPPKGILDLAHYEALGCASLWNTLYEIPNKCVPKLHIFGHIHEGYGAIFRDNIQFLNVAHCDGNYRPINKPVTYEIL